MVRRSQLATLAAAGLTLALAAAPAASAASMTRTLALHGGMYAPKAMATARITQVSAGDYRIRITAAHLPAPAMLHVKPQRHAYLAWAIDGMDKHAMMGIIPLTLNKATGVYSANRVVMLKHVTKIVVTAETNAMQHMPTMPEVTVLSSGKASM